MSQKETLSIKKGVATGGETVSVASKLPMGIVLQLYDFKPRHEPVMGGGAREYKQAEPRHGATFIVDGNSFAQNVGPQSQIAGGFAITHGVPKAFWEEWLDQNKHADYVVNGMIFAHAEAASTVAHAKDNEGEKSGLERLDPKNLPKGLSSSDEVRRAA
jgi:hypothetical protein